jgi:hypothetical protein
MSNSKRSRPGKVRTPRSPHVEYRRPAEVPIPPAASPRELVPYMLIDHRGVTILRQNGAVPSTANKRAMAALIDIICWPDATSTPSPVPSPK